MKAWQTILWFALGAIVMNAHAAHASQDDDLHRIAVAVERIAAHVEKCK